MMTRDDVDGDEPAQAGAGGDAVPSDALSQQLDRLQQELTRLHDRQEQDDRNAPVAPWLARRGTPRIPGTRTLPPWLARRGPPR